MLVFLLFLLFLYFVLLGSVDKMETAIRQISRNKERVPHTGTFSFVRSPRTFLSFVSIAQMLARHLRVMPPKDRRVLVGQACAYMAVSLWFGGPKPEDA